MESTCNWGKNPGVFHVDFFMCIIGVDLHMDIKWSLSFIFFPCMPIPRCISHLDCLCTFLGVFQVNCFT